ncbi:CTD small phosphatase-like protein [Acrasis kona]|uniref:CTD small phosphatase-like protein n=1 Tax=Acrasis kona TaxID=1008807 RepID=A0AAW2Z8U2_9EUKA
MSQVTPQQVSRSSRHAKYKQWVQNDKNSPHTPTTPISATGTTPVAQSNFITSAKNSSVTKKRSSVAGPSQSNGILIKETKHNNVNKITIQKVSPNDDDDMERTDENDAQNRARKKFHNNDGTTTSAKSGSYDSNELQIDEDSDLDSLEDAVDDCYNFSYQLLFAYEYEDEEEFDLFRFVGSLPPKPRISPNVQCIPPKNPNSPAMTLVLDLDETLVHCSTDAMSNADFVFPVLFHGTEYQVNVRKRPYFEEFLRRCRKHFEIIVFTASQKVYADKLLDILDPHNLYIDHRVFRDSCVVVDGNYMKDLEVLGRDLSKIVIVDNSPQAYGYQVDNGIPIISFFDNESDDELLKLLPFLRTVLHSTDVRPLIQKRFKMSEMIERYRKSESCSPGTPTRSGNAPPVPPKNTKPQK